ncbi:phosphoglycerol transferase I [Kluyvera cryocrescens]|uniref:Phosphoglycerol transferase I n=1 Tax=Kluyvera cryocrescens TaxID=580 RepID=A0A485BDE7_KLUCR|nr:phosphoglycerol transferase I [Kluyvera cryocrescens]
MALTLISRSRYAWVKNEQLLTLNNDVTTTTLHFENPADANTLVIVPPDPQSTNDGNILGHSPRQLGIGMVEIKVVASEG